MRLLELDNTIRREHRTAAIDSKFSQFQTILKTECSVALTSKIKIIRYIQGAEGSILFGDSGKHTRISRNTKNYYTVLLDQILPDWRPFPARSKSFICTSVLKGQSITTDYTVYPVGDPLVGVCPSEDFWTSFQFIRPENFWRVFELMKNIYSILIDESSERIISVINHIDKIWAVDMQKTGSEFDVSLTGKLIYALKGSLFLRSYRVGTDLTAFDSFSEALAYLFDPRDNGFQLKRLSELTVEDEEREIWFSGPAYFVRQIK